MFDVQQQSASAASRSVNSSEVDSESYLTPQELADRWRIETMTLANQRSRGEGLPYLKTPSGSIRYKLSDVLRAEAEGTRGFTWARLSNALRSVLDASPDQQEQVLRRLKVALSS